MILVAPYREIAVAVAERLAAAREGADPLAAWDVEVIVPSQGVAEAIAGELLLRLPRGIAGLRLDTLESLARRLVNGAWEFPRVASDTERRLAMRTAIRSIEHPMMESRGIAAMLERSYRDVRDSGVTLPELANRVRTTARELRNAQRTSTILRAFGEYERLIAQLGVMDPSELLTRAAARAASARTQILAGFYDMTGVQRKLVEALIAAGKIAAVWVPTDMPFAQGLLQALGDGGEPASGRARGTGAGQRPALLPRAKAVEYPTPYDELHSVCASIRELLDAGVAPRDIAIVARSLGAYDAHLLQRFAHEHGFATTLAEETPLTAHRIGRGMVTLLRLRDRGFPRADVIELLRDGLRTRTRIDIDEADLATRRARVAGGTSAELAPLRNRSRILSDYIDLVAELEALPAKLDASLFRAETEADLAAAETIDEIAALFKRAAVWNRGTDVASMLDALEHATLGQRATANQQPVIWTGEILRFRGRSFRHLFAVRMQDDVFPQRRNEDPLLPDGDRRRLRLREIGDGKEEEQLLHELLYDGTSEELRLSYAVSDGFGKILRPSRFLRGVERRLHSQLAIRDSQFTAPQRSLQLLAKAGSRSAFDGYLTAIDVADRLQTLSPTQLEDFGECPQKFLLKHILGVEDVDHPERELQIDHRDKGILDHRILEQLYRELKPARLTSQVISRLEELVDEAFREHEERVPPFNRTVRDIERRATKRILRAFLAHDLADLEATGLRPRFFEYRFGLKHGDRADRPEAFLVDGGGTMVRVEGTIDRIDVGDDRYRIVDYKSGKAKRHEKLTAKIDRGVRLQLALYAMAVSEFFQVPPERVSGTIKPIVVEDLKPANFAFELAEKREALLETLRLFVTSIRNGVFPAFPNEGDFDSCKYCPVNHSCRTKHDTDERHAVQQWKDPRTLLAEAAAR